MRLKDKTIIVTGSTTGIGKAIAKRCLEEGAEVFLHGLELELAQETWTELDPERQCTDFLVSDLTEHFASKKLIETAISRNRLSDLPPSSS